MLKINKNFLFIFRSGEEGIFPDLIKFAEEKLRKLSPNSRALRFETPIMTKDSLPEEEWKEVENDLLSWENEMKVMDKSLEFEKKRFDVIGNKNLPEIRKVEPVKQKVVSLVKKKKMIYFKQTAILSSFDFVLG